MVIRKLEKNEIDSLLELYKHYTSEENVPELTEKTKIEIWEAITQNPCVNYFVIETNDKIIASCILTITPSFIRGGKAFGFIEHVVVHSDYRQNGYAQKILNHVMDYAWENSCTEVMLLSGSYNQKAHQLYRKLEFDENRKKGFILFKPKNKDK